MKKLFIFAASAALLAACSQSDDLALGTAQQAQAQVEETPVAFDVYAQKGTTRAGVAGDITTEILKMNPAPAYLAGFGVFSFYTDDEQYAGYTVPDFMYNQQVRWDKTNSVWTYSPVKYWPNEYGAGAVSNSIDYLSFFAYAPYVAVDPSTGLPPTMAVSTIDYPKLGYATEDAFYTAKEVSTGTAEQKAAAKAAAVADYNAGNIVALTKNTATGDPMVKYKATLNPSNAVDLLWGVVSGATANQTYHPIEGTYDYTKQAGLPWLNLWKSTSSQADRVKFLFKHALAKLSIHVVADVDQVTPSTDGMGSYDKDFLPWNQNGTATTTDDRQTRIWVRSITLTGFNTEGTLNLNNREKGKPFWLSFDGKTQLPTGTIVTLNDGRQDGSEATSQNTNETLAILNDSIIENATNGAIVAAGFPQISSTRAWGVTGVYRNVFKGSNNTNNGYVYVIPNGDVVSVTIVYDVETIDPNLPGYLSDGKTHGSVVENKITKTVTADGATAIKTLEAGKQYTLNLHLGMTSVKLDATVDAWVDPVNQNVNLPINN